MGVYKIIRINNFSKEGIFEAQNKTHEYVSVPGDVYNKVFWNEVQKICRENGNCNPNHISNDHGEIKEVSYLVLVDIKPIYLNQGDSIDYISFQYLFAYLGHLNQSYYVIFYRSDTNIKNQEYFQINGFIHLWVLQNNKYDNIFFLEIYENNNGDKESGPNHKRLPLKYNMDFYPSRKLLPIVSLSKDIYQALDSSKKIPESKILNLVDSFEKIRECRDNSVRQKLVKGYYEDYIINTIFLLKEETDNYFDDNILNNRNKIEEHKFIVSNPPIFVMYLYFFLKKTIGKNEIISVPVEVLIEQCYSFAFGLLQLIENSIKHVIIKDSNAFATFSIRLHKNEEKNEFIRSYININNKEVLKYKYFFEFSIIDVTQKNDEIGIIDVFNSNIHKQGLECSVEKLDEIFEYPIIESTALSEFYKNPINVSNHYGLQIFDSQLTASKGLFIVISGKKINPYIYTNVDKIKNINNEKYYLDIDCNKMKKMHFSGTTYTIISPISIQYEEVKSELALDINPILPYCDESNISLIDTDIIISKKIVFYDVEKCSMTKEEIVDDYAKSIKIIIDENEKSIVSIDASDILNHRFTRMNIELICKAVVSVISNENHKPRVICLMNLGSEYNLLDAIRIISLFFDKTGQCAIMNSKSIFLANNEYNVLFNGENLKSIFENIERQRLINSLPTFFYRHIKAFASKRNMNGEIK